MTKIYLGDPCLELAHCVGYNWAKSKLNAITNVANLFAALRRAASLHRAVRTSAVRS